MQEEQRTRDLNAGQYEAHFEKWENEIESRTLFEHAEAFVNKVVLELGCGTGRITRMLAPVSQCVLAADFSEGSLELLAASLQDETNVGLIWTDATQLRLRPKSCDAVISIQLLEHIPEQQQRIKFVRCAHLSLREGGVLLLSAYYYNGMRRILRRGQNGTHPGGIFYHRFSMAELQEQLRHGFHVQITKPIQMDRRVAKLIQPITSSLTSMMEHSFLAQLFGRLLFVKAASLPDRSF
jgi:SAM-dependent methyltransferase